MNKEESFEEWEEFVNERLPHYKIQKGSQFEAQLWLAFDEMRNIWVQKEYRLNYKIDKYEKLLAEKDKQLEEAVKLLRIGKRQFAPHTTNSEVDSFLKQFKESE